jgi:hypothetical protein
MLSKRATPRHVAIHAVAGSRRAEIGTETARRRRRQEHEIPVHRDLSEEVAILAYGQRRIEPASERPDACADERAPASSNNGV